MHLVWLHGRGTDLLIPSCMTPCVSSPAARGSAEKHGKEEMKHPKEEQMPCPAQGVLQILQGENSAQSVWYAVMGVAEGSMRLAAMQGRCVQEGCRE